MDYMMSNLAKKTLIVLVVPLAENCVPKLATKASLSVFDKFEIKISGNRNVRGGQGPILFISNEDVDGIIRTIESLENSGLLIDGATETVKHELKKQEGWFLGVIAASLIAPMASSLIEPVISTLINTITGKSHKKDKKAEKVQKGGFLSFISITFNDKSSVKGVKREGKG